MTKKSDSIEVILYSLLFIGSLIILILGIGEMKPLSRHPEVKVVIVGSVFFMYISWLVTYMANIHPFIEPIFIKNKF